MGYAYGLPTCVLKLHTERKTWAGAVTACRAEGAQLVIVDRKDINDWIAKVDIKLGGIWIGATDQVRTRHGEKNVCASLLYRMTSSTKNDFKTIY